MVSGKKVRVVIGPFAGMEGVIIRRGKKARFNTSVELFNQSVSIDIREADVESLS